MRIYVGGISTETNTFSPVLMDIAQFKKGFYFLGKEVEQVKSTTKETQGTLAYLETQEDVEIIPGFVTHGTTAGPVKEDDFRAMQELLFLSQIPNRKTRKFRVFPINIFTLHTFTSYPSGCFIGIPPGKESWLF